MVILSVSCRGVVEERGGELVHELGHVVLVDLHDRAVKAVVRDLGVCPLCNLLEQQSKLAVDGRVVMMMVMVISGQQIARDGGVGGMGGG